MSAPDLLARLPANAAAAIHQVLPGLLECAAHDGRFDLDELKTFSTRAPAVRVALLGVSRGLNVGGPAWEHDLRMGAFVVTRDAAGLPRFESAASIVQQLLTVIPANRWAIADIGEAENVDAQNLYGPGLRSLGIALWAIAWTHKVQLQVEPQPPYPYPNELYVKGLAQHGAIEQVA